MKIKKLLAIFMTTFLAFSSGVLFSLEPGATPVANDPLPQAERDALIALYNNTNGDSWSNNTNWKKPDGSFNDPGTEHTWFGITVVNNHVEIIILTGNNLTGPIPKELGNLAKLKKFNLRDNQLTGSIPPELGNMSSMEYFLLSHNRLTGTIPPEICYFPNIEQFNLSCNAITGEIPPAITNLVPRYGGEEFFIFVYFNGLYTYDDSVKLHMKYNSGFTWEEFQTAPPTDVSATVNGSTSVTLNWTRIPFDGFTGRYDIYRTTVRGGPYTLIHSTDNKFVESYIVNGLLPATTYYFVIKSHTDAHQENDNAITSDFSEEISITTPVPGALTVTSPNGGDTIRGCTTFPITWVREGGSGNVAIEYSTSGVNGTYIPIVSSIADTGTYSWELPDTDSTQCFVRVRSVDGAQTDTSDAAFTMEPCYTLTVTSPNGGESISTGTTIDITWESLHLTGDVTIKLHRGNGYYFTQTLGTVDVSAGTFSWNVSGDLRGGTDYFIRLYHSIVDDVSDAHFNLIIPQRFPDFNKDGKPDLLWRHYQNGKNVIWFMDNTTRTGYKYIDSATDLNWKIDAADDFNNDGHTDIVWRNYKDGRTAVWYMDGATKTGSAWLPRTADTNWKIVGTGDFNGDGHTDIVWRYNVNGDGRNCIWYMNGVTKTGHAYFNSAANTDWQIESVNDFNNDGKPDILWRLYATQGYNVIWYMDNAAKTGHTFLNPSTNLDWKIEGTGDFNGDGQTDIIWRNYGTGQNVIWYMNGAAKTGHSFFESITDLNWDIENN